MKSWHWYRQLEIISERGKLLLLKEFIYQFSKVFHCWINNSRNTNTQWLWSDELSSANTLQGSNCYVGKVGEEEPDCSPSLLPSRLMLQGSLTFYWDMCGEGKTSHLFQRHRRKLETKPSRSVHAADHLSRVNPTMLTLCSAKHTSVISQIS